MNRKLLSVAALCSIGLLAAGCQLGSRVKSLHPGAAERNTGGAGNPGQATAVPPLGANAVPADQALSDLQSTLQAQNQSAGPVDSGAVDHDLSGLQSTLQSPQNDIPTRAPGDTLDQELTDLLSTLQAQETP
jgi:hypothetical protein